MGGTFSDSGHGREVLPEHGSHGQHDFCYQQLNAPFLDCFRYSEQAHTAVCGGHFTCTFADPSGFNAVCGVDRVANATTTVTYVVNAAGNGGDQISCSSNASGLTLIGVTLATLAGTCTANNVGRLVDVSDSTTSLWGATIVGSGGNDVTGRCNGETTGIVEFLIARQRSLHQRIGWRGFERHASEPDSSEGERWGYPGFYSGHRNQFQQSADSDNCYCSGIRLFRHWRWNGECTDSHAVSGDHVSRQSVSGVLAPHECKLDTPRLP